MTSNLKLTCKGNKREIDNKYFLQCYEGLVRYENSPMNPNVGFGQPPITSSQNVGYSQSNIFVPPRPIQRIKGVQSRYSENQQLIYPDPCPGGFKQTIFFPGQTQQTSVNYQGQIIPCYSQNLSRFSNTKEVTRFTTDPITGDRKMFREVYDPARDTCKIKGPQWTSYKQSGPFQVFRINGKNVACYEAPLLTRTFNSLTGRGGKLKKSRKNNKSSKNNKSRNNNKSRKVKNKHNL